MTDNEVIEEPVLVLNDKKYIISDLSDEINNNEKSFYSKEQPIELGFENISNKNLYIKVYGFKTYNNINDIINNFNNKYNITTK